MDLSSRDGRRQLGERIAEAAAAAGLTLPELASAIGCSRALIYQYASGQVLAQADRLQAIAELCGVTLAWFFAEESAPVPPPAVAPKDAKVGPDLDGLLALARAQSASPDFAAARQTYQRARDLAAESTAGQALALAELRLGEACLQAGDAEAARSALLRCLSTAGAEAPTLLAARQSLGAALSGLGDRDRALREFETIIASGDPAMVWRGRLGRADIYESLGRGEEALAELDRAETEISEISDRATRDWAQLYLQGALANVYLLHDDLRRALDTARASAPLAEELAAVDQHVEAQLNLAVAKRRLFDLAGAGEALAAALRVTKLTADQERQAVTLALQADWLAVLGRLEEAKATGAEARARAVATSSARGEILAQLALSAAALRAAEPNEALHQAQQALAAAAAHGLVRQEAEARLLAAHAAAQLGQTAGALVELRRVASIADRIGARALSGWAALARGGLCDAADEAEAALGQARDWAEATGDGELHLMTGLALADASSSAAAAEESLAELMACRDSLLRATVEEAMLECSPLLTRVVACLKLLPETKRTQWLDRLAWPPLSAMVVSEE